MLAVLLSVALQAPPTAAPKADPVPPPAAGAKPPATPAPTPPAAPKPETLDEQIKRALSTHPDLRIAQLQAELAQAKLEQERQRVTQLVTKTRALRDAVLAGRDIQDQIAKRTQASGGSRLEVLAQEGLLAQYQEKLAVAEAELLAAVGGPQPAAIASITWVQDTAALRVLVNQGNGDIERGRFLAELLNPGVPPGPATPAAPTPPATPGDFRADLAVLLEQRITPAVKKGTVRQLLAELLGKAAKTAGKPAPGFAGTDAPDEDVYALNGDADTLGGWLQQLTDAVTLLRGSGGVRFNLYVREYGLLPAWSNAAPAGAVTVAAFWERARAERAAKDRPAPPAKK